MRLACPFCACEVTREVTSESFMSRMVMKAISCLECGSTGPYRTTWEEAEVAWNFRDGKVMEVEEPPISNTIEQ